MESCFADCRRLNQVTFDANSPVMTHHWHTSMKMPSLWQNFFHLLFSLEVPSVMRESGVVFHNESELYTIEFPWFYTNTSREFNIPITVQEIREGAFHPYCSLTVDGSSECGNTELVSS